MRCTASASRRTWALHGGPTCVMHFDDATGWLIGEPNRGLAAMFVMMNSARLHCAKQGIGLLDAAWQKADAYSRERRQMKAPGATASAAPAGNLPADHPAMRRILDTQRAWIDGARVLAYCTAIELDIATPGAEPEARERAQRWCALVRLVLKAACTQQESSRHSKAPVPACRSSVATALCANEASSGSCAARA